MAYAEQGMNDFHCIRSDRYVFKKFKPEDSYAEHLKTMSMLKSLEKPDIILTHHCPSFNSVHEKYKKSPLTPAFASNLDSYIHTFAPKLWVHGHTHESFEYVLGNTRIICNPLGYPGENETFYNPTLIREI